MDVVPTTWCSLLSQVPDAVPGETLYQESPQNLLFRQRIIGWMAYGIASAVSSSSSPRRRCSTRCSGGNITKKVGGWRPLVDETPTSQSKTKRQFTRRGNLEKRTGSKKLLILTGKQKNIKPKLPNKKRKLRALWFNLVAAFDQKDQPPLPQVVSKFLRIKDVDLPASFIQKYLMQKLNLSSEAEVDILCGGKPVSPGMTLHDLAGCWLNKGQKGRVRSSVGTPADGFIAKVFYGRSGSSKPETENNQGWSRASTSFLKQRRVISFLKMILTLPKWETFVCNPLLFWPSV